VGIMAEEKVVEMGVEWAVSLEIGERSVVEDY
jgi:hypothetical protein